LVDPTEVVLADLNQDGALDLASANEGSDDVTLFFQEADLKFASPLALGGGGASQGPRELLAADMDRDGDLDLAWADSSALTVAFQESEGAFRSITLTGPAFELQTVDFEGDGDLDLVTGRVRLPSGSREVAVLLQQKGGAFAPPLIADHPSHFSALVASDLEGDGDADVITADLPPGALSVFRQDPTGTLASPFALSHPAVTLLQTLVSLDVDGDGDMDLATADLHGPDDSLFLFLQTPLGGFADALTTPGPAATNRGLYVADLDADGDTDFVTHPSNGGLLGLYRQELPGAFSAGRELPYPVTNDLLSTRPVDLDGDGEVDLVSASGDRLLIQWGGR
jgi:hypothetical protein